jgi:flagellar protein FliS
MQVAATYESPARGSAQGVPTAPVGQGDVLLMLYDGAIRFVGLAKDQINSGNAGAKEISLAKAYAIISEFIQSLDHERAPELCSNLEQIYEFMLAKLAEANGNMDAAPLDIVLCHLTEMRETWSEAVARATA